MSTYLLPITFFNEYIIAPYTCLHYFKNQQKICITFLYLSLFYYLNTIYYIIIIFIFLLIIINFPIDIQKSILNLNNFFLTFFLIINIFLYNSNQYDRKSLIKKNCVATIPEFAIRLILIPIISNLLLKILFLTTKYEFIISSLLLSIKAVNKSINKKVLFIFTISSQILLLIVETISLFVLSIFLRNMDTIFNFNKNNVLLPTYSKIQNLSYFHVKRMSYIMYIKKINYIDFSVINLKIE